MTDRPQQEVARLTRRMTGHANTVIEHIAARPAGAPVDEPPRPPGRGGGGIPRPAERPLVAWEDGQRRDAMRLARLLTGHDKLTVLGAAQIADKLGQPIVGYDLDQLVERLSGVAGVGGDPLTPAWKRDLRDLAGAWHEAGSSIHDGWSMLWLSRWRNADHGVQALDELVETEALEWLGRIRDTARQLSGLCNDLTGRPRLCACGCRRPSGRGRYAEACQKRNERKERRREATT